MDTQIYAPVIIPTLCRYDHFKGCVESLEKCTGAEKTDVYIGIDFPPVEKYVEGWKKICKYVENKKHNNCFKSFNIFKRETNCGPWGPGSNSELLLEYILDHYDRWIASEDDNTFSPNYLEYMNQCLSYYEKDNDVVAICGYSYPIEWEVSERASCLRQNINVSMWGAGFWKSKYLSFDNYLAKDSLKFSINKAVADKSYCRMIDAAQMLYFENACMWKFWKSAGTLNMFKIVTDVAMRCYLAVENKYVIAPVLSKVRNHGFDGTGSCCQEITELNNKTAGTYNYAKQPIDTAQKFELFEDTLYNDSENRVRLNTFDYRSPRQMKKTKRLIWLCENIGVFCAKIYCMLVLPFEAIPYFIQKMKK